MSEGGEPKQNTQNHLTSPMSEGGEPKQNTQNYLTSHPSRHINVVSKTINVEKTLNFSWM